MKIVKYKYHIMFYCLLIFVIFYVSYLAIKKITENIKEMKTCVYQGDVQVIGKRAIFISGEWDAVNNDKGDEEK